MNTEMIKIYAPDDDKALIMKLVSSLCSSLSMDIHPTAIYYRGYDEASVSSDYDMVVCVDDKERFTADRVLTYSADGLNGDVSLLNVQQRTEHKSFEILYKNYMGRVFLPNGSEYTEKQVLVAAATLLIMGAEAKPLLLAVNEIIKKGE